MHNKKAILYPTYKGWFLTVINAAPYYVYIFQPQYWKLSAAG